jgi:hypothetical protein
MLLVLHTQLPLGQVGQDQLLLLLLAQVVQILLFQQLLPQQAAVEAVAIQPETVLLVAQVGVVAQ